MDVLASFYRRHLAITMEAEESGAVDGERKKKPLKLETLLEKGNKVGFRALHEAMKYQAASAARRLVNEYRVDVNPVTPLQQTPAHIAAHADFADGVEILRNSPRDVAANFALKDTHGYTAAQVAHSKLLRRQTHLILRFSVLEGGYNFHGMVSPFARSVAVHARARVNPAQEPWDEEKIAKEATRGRQLSNADCGNVPRCDDATDEEAQQDRAVTLANSRSKREKGGGLRGTGQGAGRAWPAALMSQVSVVQPFDSEMRRGKY
ncbi:hypothetical protein JG688_00015188 [Phytophthora aleatoria]|uniref:Uncharacterized protein n=1 Tax=Phytophthora aleatoria TaxID=2496075 RepID=A0A8J5IZS1_9STRA|nr:hypothetical protein JG688_00015188 [Phytophthora aleatoria]